MIVDDNSKVRGLIRLALDTRYVTIIECVDGVDALKAYAMHHPDLVLMDVYMPRLDGLAATKALKAKYPNARVHLLSDYEEDEIRYAAAAAGACGYTSKAHLDCLESIIRQYSD